MCAKSVKDKDVKAVIIDAALKLAEEQGWQYTTLRDIARESGLTAAQMHDEVDDKNDVLQLLGRSIDRAVLDGVSVAGADNTSPRDLLFDILMDRYEALNEYREGLVAILESFKYDPKQAVVSMPHLCKSMSLMLEYSGIETSGIKGAVKVAGLTGIYLKVLKTWMEDESADLAKTMAALDKALERAERTAGMLGF